MADYDKQKRLSKQGYLIYATRKLLIDFLTLIIESVSTIMCCVLCRPMSCLRHKPHYQSRNEDLLTLIIHSITRLDKRLIGRSCYAVYIFVGVGKAWVLPEGPRLLKMASAGGGQFLSRKRHVVVRSKTGLKILDFLRKVTYD